MSQGGITPLFTGIGVLVVVIICSSCSSSYFSSNVVSSPSPSPEAYSLSSPSPSPSPAYSTSSPSPSPSIVTNAVGLLSNVNLSSSLSNVNSQTVQTAVSNVNTQTLQTAVSNANVQSALTNLVNALNALNTSSTSPSTSTGTTSHFTTDTYIIDLPEFNNLVSPIKTLYKTTIVPILNAFFSKFKTPLSDQSLQILYGMSSNGLNTFLNSDKYAQEQAQLARIINDINNHDTPSPTANYGISPPAGTTIINFDEFKNFKPNMKQLYKTGLIRVINTFCSSMTMSCQPPASVTTLVNNCISSINTNLNPNDPNTFIKASPSPLSGYQNALATFGASTNTLVDLAEFNSLDNSYKIAYKICVIPAIQALLNFPVDITQRIITAYNSFPMPSTNMVDVCQVLSNIK
jgi:hypothetical protein